MGFTPKVCWYTKAQRALKGVEKGELYTSNDCNHAKHGVGYVFKGRESMLQLVVDGLMGEECKKIV
jgi:hypothetical protein